MIKSLNTVHGWTRKAGNIIASTLIAHIGKKLRASHAREKAAKPATNSKNPIGDYERKVRRGLRVQLKSAQRLMNV